MARNTYMYLSLFLFLSPSPSLCLSLSLSHITNTLTVAKDRLEPWWRLIARRQAWSNRIVHVSASMRIELDTPSVLQVFSHYAVSSRSTLNLQKSYFVISDNLFNDFKMVRATLSPINRITTVHGLLVDCILPRWWPFECRISPEHTLAEWSFQNLISGVACSMSRKISNPSSIMKVVRTTRAEIVL